MIVLAGPRLGFHGGVERHVHDLAVGLRSRGHRVALAHAPQEGRDPANIFDRDAKAILEQWVALHPDSTEAKRLESHLAQMGPRAERVMRKTIER